MKNKKYLLPLLAFAAAEILWGLNTPFIKLSLESFPVLFVIAVKYTGAGLFLTVISFRRWKRIPRKYWLRILVATLIGYSIMALLTYAGLQRTSGVNASLVILAGPVLLFYLSVKVLKEKLNTKVLLGLLLGLMGGLLIVGAPLLKDGNHIDSNTVGNLLIMLAVVVDVISTVMIKPVLNKIQPVQITAIRFLIASATFLPFVALKSSTLTNLAVTPGALVGLAYNTIFASIIAYWLYHYGFSKISGEQSSVLYYLDPVAGVVASLFILKESLTTPMLLGAGLVVWGVYVGEVKHRRFFSHHR